ncbi:MAG TPA: DegT/DnrJ/EryC1/StrS family aminotransferase [Cyclobacteriaceae bacterium]|nr:DegT/DnrJ/EryC1/StrS family aminotransferase [Cyclobacteriaceae bacterium]
MTSVPFCSLKYMHDQVKSEIDRAFSTVYNRGQFILGSEVGEFEKAFASYTGTRYCVGVASGLDALVISLKATGVGEGDEVIVPAHTYIASWLAVSHTGAKVVPVDVEDITMLLDIDKTKQAITRKTKAIMPVHLYGYACRMPALVDLANQHDLVIVEDNAQAHGAKCDNVRTGSFGDCNATSFYPTKNLGALGDGGAITTDNPDLAQKIFQMRNYGSKEQFINPVKGFNSRLDELQAAVLNVKLQYLDEWNAHRSTIAKRYTTGLRGVGDLILPPLDDNSVFHQFVVRTKKREGLRTFLFQKGVGTMIHYPVPPHLQGAYRELNFQKGAFPVAEELAASVLSLPIWPGLSETQQDWVVAAVKEFFASH